MPIASVNMNKKSILLIYFFGKIFDKIFKAWIVPRLKLFAN